MMDFSPINSQNQQNEDYHQQIAFPSRTDPHTYAINTTPRISAIKTTKQIHPFNYLFQPVDPPQFSSHNNHGICVKVIEYVLEIEKRRLTDQASKNTHDGANVSEHSSINYDTVTMNNQVHIPTDLNIQDTPTSKSSIVITHNGVNKKCIPSVPTSELTPFNQIMYEKSIELHNLSKIKKSVASTFNTEQNGFPQMSNSTGEQYFSSFARYIPKTPDIQLISSPIRYEYREETKNVHRPYYDTPLLPSFQLTNEIESLQLIINNTAKSKSHVSVN
ncbi:PREDICTED: uncharacterized protein LOC107161866 [Diuraphis noxia]|uniref:uncharacterized protein LOC107161866 n=1 Tax=Diuraphis noxia TaxID=143948 RepID=UPI000763A5F2|nr:PREDICTED: uncharacterized protein LOC107161866 [Diuraphis noxia]